MDQCDLFGEPLPIPELDLVEMRLPPLAAPCAFRNRSNNPCQRLAHEPIQLDGKRLYSRGRLLLHCPRACFDGAAAGVIDTLAEVAE